MWVKASLSDHLSTVGKYVKVNPVYSLTLSSMQQFFTHSKNALQIICLLENYTFYNIHVECISVYLKDLPKEAVQKTYGFN